jgi:hypothetical protein
LEVMKLSSHQGIHVSVGGKSKLDFLSAIELMINHSILEPHFKYQVPCKRCQELSPLKFPVSN